MANSTFLAGQRVSAAALNLATEKCITRGRRTNAGTTTTTAAQGYYRIDDIPLTQAYLYAIRATGVHPQSTVGADAIQVDIYYTTDGSTPTTSSAILDGTEFFCRPGTANSAESNGIDTTYTPSGGSEQISLLIAYKRIAGTGNVNLFGSSDAAFELSIHNNGPDPGSVGTSI